MLKIGEIWQYLMHRKAQFGILLLALLLGVGCGVKLMSLHRSRTIDFAPEFSHVSNYANTLLFRINGANGKPSYELRFNADYTNASVKVYNNPLSTSAAVKVYAQNCALLSSEVATLAGETYNFSATPKSYNISLRPGYTLEFTGNNIQVISNLTGGIATDYLPNSATERYVVMRNGLRKERWGTGTGEQMMYNLLKTYLGNQISAYRAKISPDVLNNKTADATKKAQVIAMYETLEPGDRAAYGEFISQLKRGGVPKITYTGERQYEVGAQVDLAKLVQASDSEDGDYRSEDIKITSNLDTSTAGEYSVSYKVSDGDGNTVTYNVPLTVITKTEPTPSPTPAPTSPSTPSTSSPASNLPQRENLAAAGSGSNLANDKKPVLIEIPEDSTIWDSSTELSTPETLPSAVNVSIPSAETNQSDASSTGITASQIILLVIGVVLILGFVRFIFDHYVR